MTASTKPLILSILKEGKSYGYLIIHRVKELSGGSIEWSDGMLYPVLHRLEAAGLVESRWQVADNGRRRKYYAITLAGTEELGRLQEQWSVVHSALQKISNPDDVIPHSG